MEHKVLTLNGQGSIPKNLSVEGMDLPMKRRHAIQKIISDEKPDIILMQESKNCDLEYICNQDFGNKKYTYVENNSKKDAAIIYDSTKFKRFENPTNTKTHILNMKPEISKDADLRMCAVILQEKCQNRQPFLCATWHGPSKIQYGEKKKIYRDLCLCLGLYLYEKQIPVILGGDFNLDLMSVAVTSVCWPSTKPVCYNIVVNDYPKLENRPNKIDYILTSETFNNVCCTPVNILKIVDKLFHTFTLSHVKSVLDNNLLTLIGTSKTDIDWNSKIFLKSEDKVLVMNAQKLVPNTIDTLIKGVDLPNLRMEVMYEVIKDENPDIILIQESNCQLNNICKKFENGKYQAIDGEDAGIIFNATKFDLQLTREETTRQLLKLDISEISKRMCVVILQQKGPNTQPFHCVSWRGSHSKLREIEQIENTLGLPIYLNCSEKETFPVIVGKDFNLDEGDCTSDPYNILISDTNENLYTRKLDTRDIIKKLDISCPKLYLSLTNVFDHDPLICTITQP